jgi:hypothetical protein
VCVCVQGGNNNPFVSASPPDDEYDATKDEHKKTEGTQRVTATMRP